MIFAARICIFAKLVTSYTPSLLLAYPPSLLLAYTVVEVRIVLFLQIDWLRISEYHCTIHLHNKINKMASRFGSTTEDEIFQLHEEVVPKSKKKVYAMKTIIHLSVIVYYLHHFPK